MISYIITESEIFIQGLNKKRLQHGPGVKPAVRVAYEKDIKTLSVQTRKPQLSVTPGNIRPVDDP